MLNENWLALAFPSHIVKIKSLSISFLIRPGMKKSRYFKSLPPFPIVPSYSKRLKFLKKYSTLGVTVIWWGMSSLKNAIVISKWVIGGRGSGRRCWQRIFPRRRRRYSAIYKMNTKASNKVLGHDSFGFTFFLLLLYIVVSFSLRLYFNFV